MTSTETTATATATPSLTVNTAGSATGTGAAHTLELIRQGYSCTCGAMYVDSRARERALDHIAADLVGIVGEDNRIVELNDLD
jgi:hypothetical protein